MLTNLVNQTETISDNNIVPEDYQNMLMYLRDSITSACFAIGDIANDLVAKASETGFSVTDQRVFQAVGRFCGKSARTVRYYAETSAFYSPDERDIYTSVPFSHFVFARSVGDGYREVLDFSAANPSVSLELLRYNFGLGKVLDPEKMREYSQQYMESDFDNKSCEDSQPGAAHADSGEKHEDSQDYEVPGRRRYENLSALSDLADSISRVSGIVSSIDEAVLPARETIIADLTAVKRHIVDISNAINGL